MKSSDIIVMDEVDKRVACFARHHNFVRNVAMLRTGLCALYKEVKRCETKLRGVYGGTSFSVSGDDAMVTVMFDWFSVSMLNLMDGVSLLDTLACEKMDYVTIASTDEGMKRIKERARQYSTSICEAGPLSQWRNKVAAHRSGIHPPPQGADPMETKVVSMIGVGVAVKSERYVAGHTRLSGAGVDSSPDSSALTEWSLTDIWEALLGRRYPWLNDPNFFDSVDNLQLGGPW